MMTTNGSIFTTQTLDRHRVQWESHLDDLTPVQVGSVTYKRDDWWAPLGYGGINGFKARQASWLLTSIAPRAKGLIFAGSVKSTQHAMVATVARHFGIPSVHVLGATSPETCLRHESVAIAAAMGAEFDIIAVAYNPALQKRAQALKALHPEYFLVEYGVGFSHEIWSASRVLDYHAIGAAQVENVPLSITTVVMPAGSCHAATSIIVGLQRHQRMPVLHLVGIGPLRSAWLQARLKIFGIELSFAPPVGSTHYATAACGAWRLPVQYHDLIGEGYFTYHDMWDESRDGIVFHPTYEAKMMRWLRERAPELIREETLVWIVGSAPSLLIMQPWGVGASSMASPNSAP